MPTKEKYPWLPFFTGDWLKDPDLSLCSPATRGVWMDLLCAMHQRDRSGELRGTVEQLARIARCSTVELTQALTDLQTTGAADVTERNGIYTVTNRRMSREAEKRQANTARQVRRRHGNCRASVAPNVAQSSRDRSQKSESESDISPSPSLHSALDEQPFGQGEEGEEVFDPDGDEWASLDFVLRRCGVQESQPALRAARLAGCSPSLVGMLISHWEAFPKAWTPGYLYARLKRLQPSDDPSQGWPEKAVEWRQAQEAKRRPKALPPSRAEVMEQDRQLREALEAGHGRAVDSLSDEQLDEAVSKNLVLADRVKRSRRSGNNPRQDAMVREHLLTRLAKEMK